MFIRFSRVIVAGALFVAACGDTAPNNNSMMDLSMPSSDDLSMTPTRDMGDMAAFQPNDMSATPDMTPISQIDAVRSAAMASGTDGGAGVSLPVDDVVVTYVRQTLGADRAGFFVQADPTGPALFVGIDPATLNPAPIPGDRVSFVVNSAVLLAGVRTVDVLSGWTRSAQGVDLATFLQDVSSKADVVSMLNSYESELIKLTGTVAGPFISAGSPFVAAPVSTSGLAGSPDLRLRLPSTVRDSIDLTQGCQFTLEKGPMWRFNAVAQPSAFVDAEVTISMCPAPKVVSALALSSTSVRLTFDRQIAPASVVADGSQFTFDNSLTASAATVSGTTVVLTTSAQTPRTTYKVTVAATVTDTRATGVAAPNNQATFAGFEAPAQLVINEVNPNIASAKDLIELLVIAGGTVKDIRVQQDSGTLIATLPDVVVATGDIIVVHCDAQEVTTAETTNKNECAASTCFTDAWDFGSEDNGLTFTNRLIAIRNPDGSYQDVVPFYTSGGNNASFPTDLQLMQSLGMWLPANCGGAPCTYASNPTAQSISVLWTGAGTSRTGNSLSRKPVPDTNTAADWNAPTTPSWGQPNPVIP